MFGRNNPTPASCDAVRCRGQTADFDRFATHTSGWVLGGWFFALCVLIVLFWLPTIWVLPTVDTWQLAINTATAIIAFLLVALRQNTQSRSDKATAYGRDRSCAATRQCRRTGRRRAGRLNLSLHEASCLVATGGGKARRGLPVFGRLGEWLWL
jgi:Low affinity iron permease